MTEGAARTALVGPLIAAWLRRSLSAVRSREHLVNALNVFPVADADTGTNVGRALAGAVTAVGDPDAQSATEVLRGAARGALLAAQGSSGLLTAAWLHGFSMGWTEATAGRGASDHRATLALCLGTAATGARSAVDHATEGTFLTVADAAAKAARTDGSATLQATSARLADVAWEAVAGTEDAMADLTGVRTPDSGAWALAEILEALAAVLRTDLSTARHHVSGPLPRDRVRNRLLAGAAARLAHAGPTARSAAAEPDGDEGVEYLALLRPAGASAVVALREALAGHGTALVLTSMDDVIAVHLHHPSRDRAAATDALLAAHGDLLQSGTTPLGAGALPDGAP